MKILFATDIHGRIDAYKIILDRAAGNGVDAIVYGGDLCPLGRDLFDVQKKFLEEWLPEYLRRCNERGIAFLATLGNLDLRGLDKLFLEVMDSAENARPLLERKAEFGGFTFIGSPMTTDGPFSLKDRCLRDLAGSESQFGGNNALISDSSGIHAHSDWTSRVKSLPSLEEHLASLPAPGDPALTIYVLHQPPAGTGQGIISNGSDVGSAAVAKFLENSEALLSLHGHIHESPFCGGCWQSRLGKTVTVQPGQLNTPECVSVTIELPELGMSRVY